jgi:nitrous oxidase accessory protein NosD
VAPSGAAPKAVLMLARSQKKFNSWIELLPELRDGDTVIVRGVLQGPVVVKRADVTLRAPSASAECFTILDAEGVTTLTLDADNVVILGAIIHATSQFDRKSMPATVTVAQGRAKCRLENCDIIGAGQTIKGACQARRACACAGISRAVHPTLRQGWQKLRKRRSGAAG